MHLLSLLKMMSDGEYHSGSELGDALGLSRTSIWKSLAQLQQFNIQVETVKGKGYKLSGGLDLLDSGVITSMLTDQCSKKCTVETILSCTSTNDYINAAPSNYSLDKYHACFAEFQLSGRGRRGRAWVSPFAKNVYLSVGLKMDTGVEALNGLSLVVGLSMASALAEMGVPGCKVKWPNDLLVNEQKICGILIELQGEATSGWDIICGIGMNVSMSAEDGKQIDQRWSNLQEYIQLSRNHIAANMLNSLIESLERFRAEGLSAFTEAWTKYDYLYGKELMISPTNLQGKGAGIDRNGALLLETKEGLQSINAGEVSVRPVCTR